MDNILGGTMSFKSRRETIGENINVEFIFPIHEIDSFNGEELKVFVEGIIGEVNSVVINFSDITYLNSSGLRELIQLFKVLKEKDKALIFSNVSDDIYKIFVHTNLNRLFTIVSDDEEACTKLLK